MDETIEQVIEGIKARNITLSVKDGDRIIASRPLLLDEEATLRANRAAALQSSPRSRRQSRRISAGTGMGT